MSAALIMSIIIVLGVVYSGYRNGLFSSVATLFMLTTGIVIAVDFYGMLASVSLLNGMGDYAEPLCLGVIFVVAYFLLQITANVFTPPTVHMSTMVNKTGGIGVSVLTGTILSGFLGLVLCMTPWTGVNGGRSFIGTSLVAQGIAHVTSWANGKVFDADGLFAQMKEAEQDRVCYQNLQDILLRLSDAYQEHGTEALTQATLEDAIMNGKDLMTDGLSGGKGVGPEEMRCPISNNKYVIRALKSRELPRFEDKRVIQVYDPEPLHILNGKPARMVLETWWGGDTQGRVRLGGRVELIPEEKFKELMPEDK